MKAIKQYFFVELFIILYKLVPKFDSMDERLQYDHSNKTNWEVLSCGAVYYVTYGGSNFWVYGWYHWPLVSLVKITLKRLCLTFSIS